MADFTQINQEIDDNIKQNGVNAITGAKMNTVLKDMVSAVNTEKQDIISDLDEIRSGAEAGATAFQKPSEGIPSTDMDEQVQAALDNAENAVLYSKQSVGITDQQRNTALANVSNQTANSTTGKMGYKVLDPTKTFAEQVTAENTIYEIRDVFDLNNGSVTIPAGCTLKFEGGKITNGTISNSVSISGDSIEKIDKTVFSDGYNITDFCVASKVGMIANDSTKAVHNGKILDSIIAKNKNLYIDDYFYLDSGHSIDYNFEIKGNGTIDTTQGDSEACITLEQGASIICDSVEFNIYKSYGSSFIRNDSVDFLIDHIIIKNCHIKNGDFCKINFVDFDASESKYGVNKVIAINNIIESPYMGFVHINNSVVYKQCLFKSNVFHGIKGIGIELSTTNEYTYINSNMPYWCDVVIDGNELDNTGFIITDINSYSTLALIESYCCYFTNNKVINYLKKFDTTGSPSLSDCYLSCVQVYHMNNVINNMCLVIEGTSSSPECHYFWSKDIPSADNIDNSKSLRYYSGNIVYCDYTEIKNRFTEAGVTIQDTDFEKSSILMLPICNNNCENYTFINNDINTNGYLQYFGITFTKNTIINNNIITCYDFVGENRYFIYASDTQNYNCEYLEIKDNIITTNNSSRITIPNFSNFSAEIRNNNIKEGIINSIGKIKSLRIDANYIVYPYSSNFSDDAQINVSCDIHFANMNIGYLTKCHTMQKHDNLSDCVYYIWYPSELSNNFYSKIHIDLKQSANVYDFIVECNPTTKKYTCYDLFGNIIATNNDGESGNERVIISSMLDSIRFTADSTYRRFYLVVSVRNNSSIVETEIYPLSGNNFKTFPTTYKILVGTTKWDYTNNKLVVWNGTDWVNLDGTPLT